MRTFLLCKMSLIVITVKLFLYNLCTGTHRGGFQFLLILDLWGISFNAVIVIGLGKNLLFKSVLGHCDMKSYEIQRTENFLPPGDTRLGFFLCQVQSNGSSFQDFLYGTGKTEM